MPWKFVCDLRLHEVLQTTVIRPQSSLTNFHGIKYIKSIIYLFIYYFYKIALSQILSTF